MVMCRTGLSSNKHRGWRRYLNPGIVIVCREGRAAGVLAAEGGMFNNHAAVVQVRRGGGGGGMQVAKLSNLNKLATAVQGLSAGC